LNSPPSDTRIERLDSIDLAIVILVWGTVIAYFINDSEIIKEPAGSIFRYSCVGFAALIGVVKASSSASKIPSEMVIFLIFVCIVFLSVFFSIDRTYSFARAVNIGMLFLFLLGVYSSMESKSSDRIVTTLSNTFLSVIFVNFVVLLLNISSTWSYGRFQGIVGHPNTMAAICMATYPLLMLRRSGRAKMSTYLLIFLFCATFLVHFLTQSRSSLGFSLFGMGIYFFLSSRKRLFYFPVLLCVICTLLLASVLRSGEMSVIPKDVTSYIERGESLESITTLTGRTTIWEIVLERISKRPLFGYGYDVEARVFHDPRNNITLRTDSYFLYNFESMQPLSLHNGYLSILVGTGIIGFVAWLYLLFCPFLLLSKSLDDPDFVNFKRSLIVMMIMGLGMNLVEYTINGGRGFFSISYWILWIVLVKVSRNSSSSPSLVAKT